MLQYGDSKIGRMFFGSQEITRAYLGDIRIFGDPYMVPYIRGGANGSYIDTGITPDETMKVIVWARNFNPSSTDNSMLFGSRDSGMTNCIQLFSGMSYNLGKIQLRFGDSTLYSTSIDFRTLGHYHKYELSSDGFFVDDTLAASISVSSMSNSSNLALFKSNNAGTIGGTTVCPIDICACKIYKGGSLVRDFTAVNSPSVGLYDAVSDTVFTNAGSGSFTYGEFDKYAYTPIRYIYANHKQYFNSGIKGSNTLPYCAVFLNRLTNNIWPNLFGAQASSSSGRYGISFGYTSNLYKRLYFLFGANTKTYTSTTALVDQDYIATKSAANVFYLYNNGSQVTTQTATNTTFTTTDNVLVGTVVSAGTTPTVGTFTGRLYHLGFGSQRNFVPALVSGVAGMYDTYNDVFYPSGTAYPFIAGPFNSPKTKQEGNMTLIRYWNGNDNINGGAWYDRVGNQGWMITSGTHEDGYYEFLNPDDASASAYGKCDDSLPDLGYHWKCVIDASVKYKDDSSAIVVDFGAYGQSGTGTCAVSIYLNSTGRWALNSKFNGNDSSSTYQIDNSELVESGLSDGDWVRRTITIGVRASATAGMDETYVIVDGLGTGVSSPFAPVRFNRWVDNASHIARGLIMSSAYPTATSTRIYSIKFYYESAQ